MGNDFFIKEQEQERESGKMLNVKAKLLWTLTAYNSQDQFED